MRTIAKRVGIGKTTVIERLSGRYIGTGHIAGGARKSENNVKRYASGSPSGSF